MQVKSISLLETGPHKTIIERKKIRKNYKIGTWVHKNINRIKKFN